MHRLSVTLSRSTSYFSTILETGIRFLESKHPTQDSRRILGPNNLRALRDGRLFSKMKLTGDELNKCFGMHRIVSIFIFSIYLMKLRKNLNKKMREKGLGINQLWFSSEDFKEINDILLPS